VVFRYNPNGQEAVPKTRKLSRDPDPETINHPCPASRARG
jgi:hypothetical protein